MKTLGAIWAIALAVLVVSSVDASIIDFKSLAIDFKDGADASAKATWSEPDILTISDGGLGWDGDAPASRDGWIQSVPMALGLSWRPTSAVSVRVSIQPGPLEVVLKNGEKSTPYAGDVYVRYSPDRVHWSTWQALEASEPQSDAEKQTSGRHFRGLVRVPHSERDQYGKLLSEYSRLDVPWKSDEDAAVRWILEREPRFFAKQLPFIGYVQFRYEAGFHGGQRIESFRADVRYGMSGLHSPPQDPDAYKDRESSPWSFRAGQAEKRAEPSDSAESR
jgi:hypothetical protein